ncbi:hypothetical protein BDV98DRAFT_560273 [Pterulicium gracile]|uniref:Uncharacterized protein n=1 Tax=Pterulicium gracile TaxID=1884261 RepID=A0A5C3QUI2_9AGAR|nr:hypothetical protein BDV98DRAFT_560273 [Pterula gracilis]
MANSMICFGLRDPILGNQPAQPIVNNRGMVLTGWALLGLWFFILVSVAIGVLPTFDSGGFWHSLFDSSRATVTKLTRNVLPAR